MARRNDQDMRVVSATMIERARQRYREWNPMDPEADGRVCEARCSRESGR